MKNEDKKLVPTDPKKQVKSLEELVEILDADQLRQVQGGRARRDRPS